MIISVLNQKGGTGKTTSTINMGFALSKLGYSVLLIDLDAQGNMTYSLALSRDELGLLDLLLDKAPYEEAAVEKDDIHVLSSTEGLRDFDSLFFNVDRAEYILSEKLQEIEGNYDFILIDCPPAISLLTTNALLASDHVLIPMQPDVFSIQGLQQIIKSVEAIKDGYESNLEILGVLPVMVDLRRKLTEEVIEYVKENFDLYVFNSLIRINVKAAEAPSFGMSVVEYAPSSNSAKDYLAAVSELLEILESKS